MKMLVKQIPVLPVVPCLVVTHGLGGVSRAGQCDGLWSPWAEPAAYLLPT